MTTRHALPTLIFLLAALPSAARADLSAKTLSKQVGLDQRLDSQVPLDLVFRDEQGQPVSLRQFFHDKPVILSLVQFRCPMLCTQVLNGVLKTSQALEFQMHRDYEVLSISIDPRETPAMAAAKKQRYASSYHRPGADEGWHFLTGDQDAIDRLAAAVGYRYVYDEKSDQFAHPSGIVVLTPDGRVSRYFYGIDYHPSDLRLGLVESSEGRIGTPVDQILLLCFHYDPATGKYGFAIAAVMRVAGIATMLVLGSFLSLMIRREYQRSHAARCSAAALLSQTRPSQPR
jgi:protein SCO1/2